MIKDKVPYSVLVIDDNPGDFTLVEDYLTEQISSPLIVHANDFNGALSILTCGNNLFDVILLDLTLPDKSGESLVKEILKMAEECPVIILTGYTDIDFSIRSISQGVSDYLLKDELSAVSLYKSIIYCIQRRKTIQRLKESEKRYSDLFHISPQPMWVSDPETFKFVQVNKAAAAHYGYTQEAFLNMTIFDISHIEDAALVTQSLDRHTQKENIFRGRFRQYKKSKELIEVEIYSNFVSINDKEYMLVIATDVTERLKYINAIETQNRKLKEIAWIQSHVIRAPLARMMSLIDLIQNHKLPYTDNTCTLGHLLDAAHEVDKLIKEISDKTYEATL